jgi:lipopolysaccharide biosynthesis glycosyltransferase
MRTGMNEAAAPFDTVTVLSATDLNYLQHAVACIASLLANNPRTHFEVLLAGTQDLTPALPRIHRSFQNEPRLRLRVEKFSLPEDFSYPPHHRFTVETYIRFWVAELLPDAHRALYLDPDIITTASIEPLWNTDLHGRTIAAVPIPGSTRPAVHGFPPGSQYFNAGVMLIDLDAWRAHRYREQLLEYLHAHPEAAIDADQDILNICLREDWVPRPYYWNMISPFYFLSHDLQMTQPELDAARRDAKIIHFNGDSKPWSYFSRHPRREEYWKYLRLTDWRDFRPVDYTPANVVRKAASRVIPAPVKRVLKSLVS